MIELEVPMLAWWVMSDKFKYIQPWFNDDKVTWVYQLTPNIQAWFKEMNIDYSLVMQVKKQQHQSRENGKPRWWTYEGLNLEIHFFEVAHEVLFKLTWL